MCNFHAFTGEFLHTDRRQTRRETAKISETRFKSAPVFPVWGTRCRRGTQARLDDTSAHLSPHTRTIGWKLESRCATNVDKPRRTAHTRAHIPDSQSGARRSPGDASWWLLRAGDRDDEDAAAAAACACACRARPLTPRNRRNSHLTRHRLTMKHRQGRCKRERLCIKNSIQSKGNIHLRLLKINTR